MNVGGLLYCGCVIFGCGRDCALEKMGGKRSLSGVSGIGWGRQFTCVLDPVDIGYLSTIN